MSKRIQPQGPLFALSLLALFSAMSSSAQTSIQLVDGPFSAPLPQRAAGSQPEQGVNRSWPRSVPAPLPGMETHTAAPSPATVSPAAVPADAVGVNSSLAAEIASPVGTLAGQPIQSPISSVSSPAAAGVPIRMESSPTPGPAPAPVLSEVVSAPAVPAAPVIPVSAPSVQAVAPTPASTTTVIVGVKPSSVAIPVSRAWVLTPNSLYGAVQAIVQRHLPGEGLSAINTEVGMRRRFAEQLPLPGTSLVADLDALLAALNGPEGERKVLELDFYRGNNRVVARFIGSIEK